MIKLIIFDLDGTLFDTEAIFHDAWRETGKKYGIEINENFLIQITGSSIAAERETIDAHYPEYLAMVEEAENLGRVNTDKVIDERLDISREGAHELIDYFYEHNYKLAIASNSGIPHVSGMAQTLGDDRVAKFSEIMSAEEVAAGKPAPDIFLEAAQRCGVDPEHTVVIEDSISGLKAAKAANMRTILITSVVPLTEDKKNHADHIVDSHHEIIELFNNKVID